MNAEQTERFIAEHPSCAMDEATIDDLVAEFDKERRYPALEAARAKLAEMKASGVPIRCRNPDEQLADRPNSLRLAVNAMCFSCMGKDAGWRADVRGCSATGCPLYPIRPCK